MSSRGKGKKKSKKKRPGQKDLWRPMPPKVCFKKNVFFKKMHFFKTKFQNKIPGQKDLWRPIPPKISF